MAVKHVDQQAARLTCHEVVEQRDRGRRPSRHQRGELIGAHDDACRVNRQHLPRVPAEVRALEQRTCAREPLCIPYKARSRYTLCIPYTARCKHAH